MCEATNSIPARERLSHSRSSSSSSCSESAIAAESIFGTDGPLDLAPLEPHAIANALERLILDRERSAQRSRAGLEFVSSHTWEQATDEVEAGLRHALRRQELARSLVK